MRNKFFYEFKCIEVGEWISEPNNRLFMEVMNNE